MASTFKTDLGFNKWILSDKPMMEDFNTDNALTDQLLADRLSKASGGTVSGETNFTGGLKINGKESPKWLGVLESEDANSHYGTYETYYSQGGMNTPEPYGYLESMPGTNKDWALQRFTSGSADKLYFRRRDNRVWKPWVLYAQCPESLDFNLVNGFSKATFAIFQNKLYVDSAGNCHIWFAVGKNGGDIPAGIHKPITVPSNIASGAICYGVGEEYTSDANTRPAYAYITGTVVGIHTQAACKYLTGYVCWRRAGDL